MKKLTLLLVFTLSFSAFNSFAQTNVSGGIYANTTWTLANSPYIVVDTVVVFPGVTLTIEAGVTVKFANSKYIEIRKATLIAQGNNVDSIIFTSNSISPTPGIWGHNYWGGIWLNGYTGQTNAYFNYCRIDYATTGIYNYLQDTTWINNCNFIKNETGIYSTGYTTYIDTTNFRYNTTCGLARGADRINFCDISNNGIGIDMSQVQEIKNCSINYNAIGVNDFYGVIHDCIINHNQKGIVSGGGYGIIRNCMIDSNSVMGADLSQAWGDSLIACELKQNGIGIALSSDQSDPVTVAQSVIDNNNIGIKLYSAYANIYCNRICSNFTYDLQYAVVSGSNTSVANNYWCTPDSISTTTRIYDGYDNISLGLVSFMPLDQSNCYLTGCNLHVTASVTNATCALCPNGSATAQITYGYPPYSYTWYTTPIQTTQTATGLASGTYTVCVTDGHGCTACNYSIFVDSTNCTGFSINATSTNASCSACSDGIGTVSTTGGHAPFAYTWYTSPLQTTQTVTNLPAGNWAVCVNDVYGCTLCDTVTIGVGSCSAYYIINSNPTPHTYDLTNMASGSPPISYDWDWGDGSPHDNIPYPTHTYPAAGNYTICLAITDNVGCTDTYCHGFYLLEEYNTTPVTVNVIPPTTTSITESANAKAFSVYPNPTAGDLTIQFPTATDAHIVIRNMLGESVYSAETINHNSYIVHTSFPPGIYFIEVNGHRQRFVKE